MARLSNLLQVNKKNKMLWLAIHKSPPNYGWKSALCFQLSRGWESLSPQMFLTTTSVTSYHCLWLAECSNSGVMFNSGNWARVANTVVKWLLPWENMSNNSAIPEIHHMECSCLWCKWQCPGNPLKLDHVNVKFIINISSTFLTHCQCP